ncbi:MAG: sulfotransferase [Hyphomonadaceae bacterium]|nr:sulfotransferase [Hyphomonadaceae bacterium]
MLVDRNTVAAALDADQLLKEAIEISGLTDFGDPRSIDALRVMVKCYAQDLQVDAGGLNTVRNTIIRQLVNRARFARDVALHPEILEEDVSDPIIILGQPRSGTTKTHRMLGVDPNLLKTYMWQLTNPAPFPDAEPGKPDPRIAAANFQDELIHASNTNPELRAGHLYRSEEVQSDLFLFGMTFNCNTLSSGRPPSPSYYEYTKIRTIPSELDNYKYVKSLFQYLQWQQGGRRGRRWLMKHETNHGRLDEVLTVYPKATLVHVHRDPRASVPSLLKLMVESYKAINPDVAAAEISPLLIKRAVDVMARYLEARDRLDLDDRIYDVPYEQIRSNPMPVFREIYRRAGHVLTPESEALMLQYELKNEQGKHGAHKYSLEQFGLTEEMIRRDFGAYIDRFIEA